MMNRISHKIYERIIYPVYQSKFGLSYGFMVLKVFKQIDRTQWLSREELKALQTTKFKKLIEHAYINVPYYREIMDKNGVVPKDIRTIDDIRHFPVLTKKLIRKNYQRLISKDFGRRSVISASTGGSTGEPLQYFRDHSTLLWAGAAELRGMTWSSYKLGDTFVDFMSPGWPSMLGKIRARLMNRHYFPAFAEKQEIMKYFEEIKMLHPIALHGYPSNLYRIAALCRKYLYNEMAFPVIFTTAEMLYDYQREFLEDQFSSEVFDYYGCNEVGTIAYECEYHRKHISDERIYAEITDGEGFPIMDALGEITITDLDNYVMPFIRYKNGDAGIITDESCDCGRVLKVMKSLDGRCQEFLNTSDGDYVSAIFFAAQFRNLRGIEQYQIIQTDVRNIILKIVKNERFSPDELQGMIRIVKSILGHAVNIDVEECHHIPLTEMGKMRIVISHVPVEF